MPSIWDDGARASLVSRARTLTTDHRARWGKLSVAGMLAHLNDATRMALDELPVQAKAPPFLKIAPVRYLVIHVLPFPRSAPTAPSCWSGVTPPISPANKRRLRRWPNG